MSRLRALLHELADEVANHLDAQVERARYYDQDTSPLPAATHCRLVRAGDLPGHKVAGRILVEREAMHRFIAAHKVEPHVSLTSADDAAIEAALERAGLRAAS